MNKLIKKLKDKNYVRAFGLMSPEEQECFRKANNDNAVIMYVSTEGNKAEWHSGKCKFDCPDYTYAIKPDYRPEPEFVDLEIVQNTDRADKWLGVHGALLASYDFVDLHCLPSLPKFVGFHYDKETTARLEDVANLMDLKETVYARLRK